MSESVIEGSRAGSSALETSPPARYSDAVLAYTILRLTFGANIKVSSFGAT